MILMGCSKMVGSLENMETRSSLEPRSSVVGRDPTKKIFDGEFLQRSDKVSSHPLPVRTKEFVPNLQVGRFKVHRWNANMLKNLIQ